MLYKKETRFVLIILFASLMPFSGYADEIEIEKEVIITVRDKKILAFSAYKSHWVSERMKVSEKVVSKKSEGNIGVVVTTDRLLAFSVFTDRWTVENLKMNEEPEEVMVEGNVATIITNQRAIGFSAHTGKWIEAP